MSGVMVTLLKDWDMSCERELMEILEDSRPTVKIRLEEIVNTGRQSSGVLKVLVKLHPDVQHILQLQRSHGEE